MNNNQKSEVKVINTLTHRNEKQQIDVVSALSVIDLIEETKKQPPRELLWRGIKEGTFGFIFGQSKSGKTILAENLAMSIASGKSEFLGYAINTNRPKVLLLSFEEFWADRGLRAARQVERMKTNLNREELQRFESNYLVSGIDFPRYCDITKDATILYELAYKHKPDVIIIDSLSRLYIGDIEKSELAKKVSLPLREFQNNTGTTLIVIHHTPKLNGKPITIDSIAGSRILAQDADFAIGVNKSTEGKRYVKDIFYRHAPEDFETVTEFSIDGHVWCNLQRQTTENALLKVPDGRRNDTNRNHIINEAHKISESRGTLEVSSSELFNKLVEKEAKMSKNAFHENMRKLEEEETIVKKTRGVYIINREDN